VRCNRLRYRPRLWRYILNAYDPVVHVSPDSLTAQADLNGTDAIDCAQAPAARLSRASSGSHCTRTGLAASPARYAASVPFDITRDGFEWALANAARTHFQPAVHGQHDLLVFLRGVTATVHHPVERRFDPRHARHAERRDERAGIQRRMGDVPTISLVDSDRVVIEASADVVYRHCADGSIAGLKCCGKRTRRGMPHSSKAWSVGRRRKQKVPGHRPDTHRSGARWGVLP